MVVGINLKLTLDFSSSRLFYPKGNSNFKPIYHALKNTDLCFSDCCDVKQFDEVFISHRILFSTQVNCSFIIELCQEKGKLIQQIILTFKKNQVLKLKVTMQTRLTVLWFISSHIKKCYFAFILAGLWIVPKYSI